MYSCNRLCTSAELREAAPKHELAAALDDKECGARLLMLLTDHAPDSAHKPECGRWTNSTTLPYIMAGLACGVSDNAAEAVFAHVDTRE